MLHAYLLHARHDISTTFVRLVYGVDVSRSTKVRLVLLLLSANSIDNYENPFARFNLKIQVKTEQEAKLLTKSFLVHYHFQKIIEVKRISIHLNKL